MHRQNNLPACARALVHACVHASANPPSLTSLNTTLTSTLPYDATASCTLMMPVEHVTTAPQLPVEHVTIAPQLQNTILTIQKDSVHRQCQRSRSCPYCSTGNAEISAGISPTMFLLFSIMCLMPVHHRKHHVTMSYTQYVASVGKRRIDVKSTVPHERVPGS